MGTECPDGNVCGDGTIPGGSDVIGEEEQTFEESPAQVRPGPPSPTEREKDAHECTGHSVFRDWCGSCVAGRGRATQHRRHDHSEETVAVISWDYGFLGSKTHRGDEDKDAESSGQSPVLCGFDRLSKSVLWYVVPAKGTDYDSVGNLSRRICSDLSNLGYKKIIFRSDGERPILSLLRLIASNWPGEVIMEQSAEGDHASNGGAESGVNLMKGHVRTLKIAVERKLNCTIPETHCLITWLVQYASRAYNRYHIGPDGRAPKERILGRRVPGPVAHFAELVHWMPLTVEGRPPAMDARYLDGYYMGYAEGSNTYIILTAQGAVRCRSIKRRPLAERWNTGLLDLSFHVLQPNPLRQGEERIGVRVPTNIDAPIDLDERPDRSDPPSTPKNSLEQTRFRTPWMDRGVCGM